MASRQHITELHIKNYRQFRRLHLNFCDPVTNAPLEKICFIGPNGAGKSTLLNLLSEICQPEFHRQDSSMVDENALLCWQAQFNENRYYILRTFLKSPREFVRSLRTTHLILPSNVACSEEWHSLWNDDIPFDSDHPLFHHFQGIANEFEKLVSVPLALQPNSNDLAIHCHHPQHTTLCRHPQRNHCRPI